MSWFPGRVLGVSMIFAAAGLILNHFVVTQSFFAAAVMCYDCVTQGWPTTNFVADLTALLLTIASVTPLLYHGLSLTLGRGLGNPLSAALLAIPAALMTVGMVFAVVGAAGYGAVPPLQPILIISGSLVMFLAYRLAIKGDSRLGAAAGAFGTLLVALVAVADPLSGFTLSLGWGDALPAALRASLVFRPEVLLSAAAVLIAVAAGVPPRLLGALLALPAASIAYALYDLWRASLGGLVLPAGGFAVALYVAGFLAGPVLVTASSIASALIVVRASVSRGP